MAFLQSSTSTQRVLLLKEKRNLVIASLSHPPKTRANDIYTLMCVSVEVDGDCAFFKERLLLSIHSSSMLPMVLVWRIFKKMDPP